MAPSSTRGPPPRPRVPPRSDIISEPLEKLLVLAGSGDFGELQVFLENHDDFLNAVDPETGDSVLARVLKSDGITTEEQRLALVRYLGGHRFDPLLPDAQRRTALHICVMRRFLSLLHFFLQKKTKVTKDAFGKYPAHYLPRDGRAFSAPEITGEVTSPALVVTEAAGLSVLKPTVLEDFRAVTKKMAALDPFRRLRRLFEEVGRTPYLLVGLEAELRPLLLQAGGKAEQAGGKAEQADGKAEAAREAATFFAKKPTHALLPRPAFLSTWPLFEENAVLGRRNFDEDRRTYLQNLLSEYKQTVQNFQGACRAAYEKALSSAGFLRARPEWELLRAFRLGPREPDPRRPGQPAVPLFRGDSDKMLLELDDAATHPAVLSGGQSLFGDGYFVRGQEVFFVVGNQTPETALQPRSLVEVLADVVGCANFGARARNEFLGNIPRDTQDYIRNPNEVAPFLLEDGPVPRGAANRLALIPVLRRLHEGNLTAALADAGFRELCEEGKKQPVHVRQVLAAILNKDRVLSPKLEAALRISLERPSLRQVPSEPSEDDTRLFERKVKSLLDTYAFSAGFEDLVAEAPRLLTTPPSEKLETTLQILARVQLMTMVSLNLLRPFHLPDVSVYRIGGPAKRTHYASLLQMVLEEVLKTLLSTVDLLRQVEPQQQDPFLHAFEVFALQVGFLEATVAPPPPPPPYQLGDYHDHTNMNKMLLSKHVHTRLDEVANEVERKDPSVGAFNVLPARRPDGFFHQGNDTRDQVYYHDLLRGYVFTRVATLKANEVDPSVDAYNQPLRVLGPFFSSALIPLKKSFGLDPGTTGVRFNNGVRRKVVPEIPQVALGKQRFHITKPGWLDSDLFVPFHKNDIQGDTLDPVTARRYLVDLVGYYLCSQLSPYLESTADARIPQVQRPDDLQFDHQQKEMLRMYNRSVVEKQPLYRFRGEVRTYYNKSPLLADGVKDYYERYKEAHTNTNYRHTLSPPTYLNIQNPESGEERRELVVEVESGLPLLDDEGDFLDRVVKDLAPVGVNATAFPRPLSRVPPNAGIAGGPAPTLPPGFNPVIRPPGVVYVAGTGYWAHNGKNKFYYIGELPTQGVPGNGYEVQERILVEENVYVDVDTGHPIVADKFYVQYEPKNIALPGGAANIVGNNAINVNMYVEDVGGGGNWQWAASAADITKRRAQLQRRLVAYVPRGFRRKVAKVYVDRVTQKVAMFYANREGPFLEGVLPAPANSYLEVRSFQSAPVWKTNRPQGVFLVGGAPPPQVVTRNGDIFTPHNRPVGIGIHAGVFGGGLTLIRDDNTYVPAVGGGNATSIYWHEWVPEELAQGPNRPPTGNLTEQRRYDRSVFTKERSEPDNKMYSLQTVIPKYPEYPGATPANRVDEPPDVLNDGPSTDVENARQVATDQLWRQGRLLELAQTNNYNLVPGQDHHIDDAAGAVNPPPNTEVDGRQPGDNDGVLAAAPDGFANPPMTDLAPLATRWNDVNATLLVQADDPIHLLPYPDDRLRRRARRPGLDMVIYSKKTGKAFYDSLEKVVGEDLVGLATKVAALAPTSGHNLTLLDAFHVSESLCSALHSEAAEFLEEDEDAELTYPHATVSYNRGGADARAAAAGGRSMVCSLEAETKRRLLVPVHPSLELLYRFFERKRPLSEFTEFAQHWAGTRFRLKTLCGSAEEVLVSHFDVDDEVVEALADARHLPSRLEEVLGSYDRALSPVDNLLQAYGRKVDADLGTDWTLRFCLQSVASRVRGDRFRYAVLDVESMLVRLQRIEGAFVTTVRARNPKNRLETDQDFNPETHRFFFVLLLHVVCDFCEGAYEDKFQHDAVLDFAGVVKVGDPDVLLVHEFLYNQQVVDRSASRDLVDCARGLLATRPDEETALRVLLETFGVHPRHVGVVGALYGAYREAPRRWATWHMYQTCVAAAYAALHGARYLGQAPALQSAAAEDGKPLGSFGGLAACARPLRLDSGALAATERLAGCLRRALVLVQRWTATESRLQVSFAYPFLVLQVRALAEEVAELVGVARREWQACERALPALAGVVERVLRGSDADEPAARAFREALRALGSQARGQRSDEKDLLEDLEGFGETVARFVEKAVQPLAVLSESRGAELPVLHVLPRPVLLGGSGRYVTHLYQVVSEGVSLLPFLGGQATLALLKEEVLVDFYEGGQYSLASKVLEEYLESVVRGQVLRSVLLTLGVSAADAPATRPQVRLQSLQKTFATCHRMSRFITYRLPWDYHSESRWEFQLDHYASDALETTVFCVLLRDSLGLPDDNGRTVLHSFIRKGDYHLVRILSRALMPGYAEEYRRFAAEVRARHLQMVGDPPTARAFVAPIYRITQEALCRPEFSFLVPAGLEESYLDFCGRCADFLNEGSASLVDRFYDPSSPDCLLRRGSAYYSFVFAEAERLLEQHWAPLLPSRPEGVARQVLETAAGIQDGDSAFADIDELLDSHRLFLDEEDAPRRRYAAALATRLVSDARSISANLARFLVNHEVFLKTEEALRKS